MHSGDTWARNFSDLGLQVPAFSRAALREHARRAVLALAGRLARFDEPAFLRCLYLHYVYDDQVDAFRRLLERLKRIGRFIDTAHAVDIVRGERPLDGRYFHLSIDDGFDNIYRNAFPVLDALEIPAVLFVPTSLIGVSDEVLLEKWWVTDERRPTRTFDWDAAREMSRAGIEIGSHTRNHARLSDVAEDPGRLTEEIAGSKRDLEDRLGEPCRFFSWPYGTWADINERVLEAVDGAGYEGCFSAVRGRVVPGRTEPFAIPRHHFEPEWPWAQVRYFAAGGREGRG